MRRLPSMALVRSSGCLRCLLLVMCSHPFAKEALTLHLARSEGHERYFDCNLLHCKVLASSHQHLMAEAPGCVPRFVEKERRPPLRHQGIRSGGNLRVFENLAQTLVAVDAP